MSRVAIGMGSNLGDRQDHLLAAVAALGRVGDVVVVSSVYETAPVGDVDQGDFLNAVAIVETDLSPREVLEACLAIEADHGRERRERWGPRTLDLDVLLYDEETVDVEGLRVPHPELTKRRFVLEPLLEVWPDAALPDGTPLRRHLPSVEDQVLGLWSGRRSPGQAMFNRGAFLIPMIVLILVVWWLVGWVIDVAR